MTLVCPHCRRSLTAEGERPAYCGHCGRPLADTPTTPDLDRTAAEPPALGGESPPALGGYRLLRQLGAGGMGTVWEAEDATGRRVAVKLIAPELAASAEAVERFRQEGRLASSISHPRCVFVLAADQERGQPFIVMELMPGETLRDLVARRGPLPPDEAVALTLDVIDGLREAHRAGVIHRDVKPSNCFLGPDGRVKVGDFGLAKSLGGGGHLTRTGAFLGTPLFASPEQIKKEVLDARSDVYSTAATLFHLLSGRAPFECGDATAAMARIVSEPPPSVRAMRPELPASLDLVLQRGLERQRERRWQSLDEFRRALLPFAARGLAPGEPARRFVAFVVDSFLVNAPYVLLLAAVLMEMASGPSQLVQGVFRVLSVLTPPVAFAYYALLDGAWGGTPGKRLLGLRVCGRGGDPPGVLRGLLRTLVFYGLIALPSDLQPLLGLPLLAPAGETSGASAEGGLGLGMMAGPMLASLGLGFWELAGWLLLPSTMRRRNGYRGLHEWLSGTRTVQLPSAEAVRRPRPSPSSDTGLSAAPDATTPGRVGGFRVLGSLGEGRGERWLLAEDEALGRRVWVRLHAESGVGEARRAVARPARLRWLTGGRSDGLFWDAFLAPAGLPLSRWVAPRSAFTWPLARPLLSQLAAELSAAAADGTLPGGMTADHLRVDDGGRLQIVDGPGGEHDTDALALLRASAVLMLEGRPRDVEGHPTGVRAPLPRHASAMLARLLGGERPYQGVAQFRDDLAATRARPATVGAVRRCLQLGLMAVFVFFWLSVLFTPVPVTSLILAVFWSVETARAEEAVPRVAGEVREAEERVEAHAFEALVIREPLLLLLQYRRAKAGLFAMQLRPLLALGAEPLGAVAVLPPTRDEAEAARQAFDRWRPNEWSLVFPLSDGLRITDPEGWRLIQERDDARRRLEGFQEELLVARPERDRRARAFAVWAGSYGPEVLEPLTSRSLKERGTSGKEYPSHLDPAEMGAVLFWPLALLPAVSIAAIVFGALVFRGGLSFWIAGLDIVRSDGRPAGRLRCTWRALLVWAPPGGLQVLALAAECLRPEWLRLSLALWLASGLLLLGYVVLTLRRPERGWHDVLAGTWVVPR